MKILIYQSLVILLFIFTCFSCGSDDELTIVPITKITSTDENVEVTFTSIEISGDVTSNGGSEITNRGVCWSTNPEPTIDDFKTEENANTFTSLIENLTANTIYNFRVYATSSAGTFYSNEQTISTSSLGDTKWDFLITFKTSSWHADVNFNADGTTYYDEPEDPGLYTANGTWSLDGNILSYDMQSDDDPSRYQFTGNLLDNTMEGTYVLGTNVNSWTATKK